MDASALQQEYAQFRDRASRLQAALIHQLDHLLIANGITLGVPIEGRVKGWGSIEEKIDRKSIDLNHIVDLNDLVGVRVILLFRNDLGIVDKLLRDNLSILESEDTGSRLNETQFGYQSRHYVVSFPREWLKLPTHNEFDGLKVEVQLRTVAQHIWAAASHKLQYKQEANVPPPLRRAIHRVSALLETVDLEFDRLLDERKIYVAHAIENVKSDTPLNADVVEKLLTELLPSKNKSRNEAYSELLEDLSKFEVKTAAQLRKLMMEQKDAWTSEEAARSKKRVKGFFFSHVGLTRMALRGRIGNDVFMEYFSNKSEADAAERTSSEVKKKTVTRPKATARRKPAA